MIIKNVGGGARAGEHAPGRSRLRCSQPPLTQTGRVSWCHGKTWEWIWCCHFFDEVPTRGQRRRPVMLGPWGPHWLHGQEFSWLPLGAHPFQLQPAHPPAHPPPLPPHTHILSPLPCIVCDLPQACHHPPSCRY
jgi:hypothetical protein